jgi:hypothetical protein
VPPTNLTPQGDNQKHRYPISGFQARQNTSDDFLTAYERTEVEEYEEVYFLAPKANKY